jgi:D-sedoheptulose 7-phosphate isomerase
MVALPHEWNGASIMAKRAVFLDRDGVINRYVYDPEFGTVDSPATPEQFALLPGVAQAIAEFNRMGLLVIGVSNQPGIAKGKFTPSLLQATTQKMEAAVQAGGGKIDATYYCLHHPDAFLSEYRAECDCRKPAPGLLLRAAQEWDIDLHESYTVGDGLADILAGQAAGTTTIFLAPRKCYLCGELASRNVEPDYQVESLLAAVPIIHNLQPAREPLIFPTCGHSNGHNDGSTYTRKYLNEAVGILQEMDVASIERMADVLLQVREQQGRLFLLGVGGGAGHASHAVCDFRKICGLEAYTPSDNVSELTARINDDGWETSYANWLRGSRLSSSDAVLVFSVGGGDLERKISANLVRALQYSKTVGATICGVVGRDGGFTAQVADACVLIKVPNPATVTPHTEAFQALVWHLLVSHPKLKASEMKWESVEVATSTAVDSRAS